MVKKNILITGCRLAGYRGDQIMLEALIRTLHRNPGADNVDFQMLTLDAKADSGANPFGVELVQLPGSLAMHNAVMKRYFLPKIWRDSDPIIAAFRKADAVISLHGITFTDQYDELTNMGHAAAILLAGLERKPYYIFVQSIGPLKSAVNLKIASCSLPRAELVMTRGRESRDNALAAGAAPEKILCSPDSSILIEPDTEGIDRILAGAGVGSNDKIIGIAPNVVIEQLFAGRVGTGYRKNMAALVQHAADRFPGARIVFMPHTQDPDPRIYDDLDLCRDIIGMLPEKTTAATSIIEADLDARKTKSLISMSTLFIGSRYHSLVASLSSGVPSISIGWTRKYHELNEWFNTTGYSIDYSESDTPKLINMFDDLSGNLESVREQLNRIKPELLQNVNNALDTFAMEISSKLGFGGR